MPTRRNATVEPTVRSISPVDLPGGDEPAWRQRAIDRSTEPARQRASQRVQRFLASAREIIEEKNSTEFTVQEVVDRSKQSLRSFYQYFDGKHELLLGLFEEEINLAVVQIRAASAHGDPLERLHNAVVTLYELCSPTRDTVQPLFFEFANRLLHDHPEEVSATYLPLFECIAEIVDQAASQGLLRPGKPRRLATLVMQSATVTAERSGASFGAHSHPITAEEVWAFCLHAIVTDAVLAERDNVKPTVKKAASKVKK